MIGLESEMTEKLEVRAADPDVDQCDVAIDAMPGFVLGDLGRDDADWVRGHVGSCNYCNRELGEFEQVDSSLEQADLPAEANVAPPRFVVPGAERCRYGVMDSPVGRLYVAVSDEGVCEISFGKHGHGAFLQELRNRGFDPIEDEAAIAPVVRQLTEYFAGSRKHFDVPVDLRGVSPFTRQVLEATSEIAFGSLITYRDVAAQIGNPAASRAVGGALGRNPVPVIVPCHRVVRSDYSIGGYTGGTNIKQGLLAIEGRMLAT